MPDSSPQSVFSFTPAFQSVSASGIHVAYLRTDSSSSRIWGNSPYEDFCLGPQFASQQEFQYKSEWHIKIDKANSSLFSERIKASIPLTSKNLSKLLLYNWSDVDSISMDFDEVGLPAIAFERSGISSIRRLIDNSLFKAAWTGVSPRIISTNAIQPDTSVRDLVCFYLNASGDVRYRIQRDNFATEYMAYGNSEMNLKFKSITKAFVDTANFRYSLFSAGLDGREYRLDSVNYPNYPKYEFESAYPDFYITSGELFTVVYDIGGFPETQSSLGVGGVFGFTGLYMPILLEVGAMRESQSSISVGGISPPFGYYIETLISVGVLSESPVSSLSVGGISSFVGYYNQISVPFSYQDGQQTVFAIVSGSLI